MSEIQLRRLHHELVRTVEAGKATGRTEEQVLKEFSDLTGISTDDLEYVLLGQLDKVKVR